MGGTRQEEGGGSGFPGKRRLRRMGVCTLQDNDGTGEDRLGSALGVHEERWLEAIFNE